MTSPVKIFLVVAGLGTMILGLAAFFPEKIVSDTLKLEYIQSYAAIVRHWGIMVFLMGVFIALSAFYTHFRNAILWYSTIEKSFMVYLYFLYREYTFDEGFFGVMIVDSTIVICTLIYFFTIYFIKPKNSP